jgi:hypothetical protein
MEDEQRYHVFYFRGNGGQADVKVEDGRIIRDVQNFY